MQKKSRKKPVWEIDRQLQEDAARPIIYQYRLGDLPLPAVHGVTVMVKQYLQRLALRGRLGRPIECH